MAFFTFPSKLAFAKASALGPLPFWRRLRARVANLWSDYRPHLHIGPCKTDDDLY